MMVTCFIAFNLLLVSVIVWLSYQSFSAVTFAEISKARLALLNESTRRGFDFITGVTGTAYALASNRELSNLLETMETGRLSQIHQRREVSRILDHTLVVSEGITSIELYTDAFNGVAVTMPDRIFPVGTISGDSWFDALEQADAAWVPLRENESGQSLIGYSQRIFDSRGGTVAYVLIRLSRADIVRRFADMPMVLDGKVLLVDTAGNVVMQMGEADPIEGSKWPDDPATSGEGEYSSSIIDSAWIQQHVQRGEDGFEVVSGKPGGSQLVLYSRPAMLQWRLVQTIPVYMLLSPVRHAGWQILGIAVLGLLCSAILAYLFVRRIIRPLRQLIKRMRQLEKGDFDTRVQLSFTEEYAHLAYGFNHMASQLTTLMEQVKDESRAKREAQTGLLEAQIKPHFLYNTLDMIHWRALDYEAKDISRMIVQLSKLLRIGLSGGDYLFGYGMSWSMRVATSAFSQSVYPSLFNIRNISIRVFAVVTSPRSFCSPLLKMLLCTHIPKKAHFEFRSTCTKRKAPTRISSFVSRIMGKVCRRGGNSKRRVASVYGMYISVLSCIAEKDMAFN